MRFVKWFLVAAAVGIAIAAGVGIFVSYEEMLDDLDAWLGGDL